MAEYLNLYKKLAEEISEGIYKHGEKLPSKRATAVKEGLSLITVEHAYRLLADEGYIVPRERSGYYVSYSDGQYRPPADVVPERSTRKPLAAEDLPGPDFPFGAWARCVQKTLSERRELIFGRSPAEGHPELRQALAEFLGRSRDIVADPGQIVIGSGSVFLYERFIQLLGRARTYAIESPSYSKIESIYRLNGVNVELLRLADDGILSAELAGTNASVLHVTPFRSYPSGVTATAAKRREYLDWAQATGRYIIEDDVESEFSPVPRPLSALFRLTTRDNVIYMNTFSVTLSPALRISYAVLPQPLADQYRRAAELYSCPVPTFEQLVLAAFIRGGDFERYINKMRRRLRQSLEASEPR